MPSSLALLGLCSSLVAVSTAVSVPSNVQALYDSIVAQGECRDKAASGFYALADGTDSFSYCRDHLDDYGILYLQGTGGALADMDIDCDGNPDEPSSSANDGRCGNSADTQSDTSFEDTVRGYGRGISNLNPYVHTYVVLGNSNDGGTPGYATFDPTEYGIEPLSLVAVVCNDQVIFGVWGDENGDDGGSGHAMVGESAISTATLCFGDSMTGDNGHTDLDVLYIAFRGSDAVPGADGADWGASSPEDFQSSLEALGSTLLARIGSTSGDGSGNGSGGGGGSCEWAGHCAGASCSTNDNCSDVLICSGGACASG